MHKLNLKKNSISSDRIEIATFTKLQNIHSKIATIAFIEEEHPNLQFPRVLSMVQTHSRKNNIPTTSSNINQRIINFFIHLYDGVSSLLV
jgi:hypothetical protein